MSAIAEKYKPTTLPSLTLQDKMQFFKRIGYNPHQKQLDFHSSMKRFRTVAAGARGGKSMAAGAEAALWFMFPDARIWICSSQYELADKEFDWALTFLSEYRTKKGERLVDKCRVISASRGSRCIYSPWGSFIRTKSTEKAQTLLGEELNVLILAEASQVKREPYERMLRARIGPRSGLLIANSTPNSDAGLFVEFFENGNSEEELYSEWDSWQFTTLDNPYFNAKEWEVAKGELDPDVFAEQYEGKFVSRFGKVFSVSDNHVINLDLRDYLKFPVVFGLFPTQSNKYVVAKISYNTEASQYTVLKGLSIEKGSNRRAAKWIADESKGYRVIAKVLGERDLYAQDEFRSLGLYVSHNEEKQYGREQLVIKQVQILQNLLLGESPRLIFHEQAQPILNDFRECTWQASRADKNRLDPETPHDLYLGGPIAVARAVCFLENARGVDIYTHQFSSTRGKKP